LVSISTTLYLTAHHVQIRIAKDVNKTILANALYVQMVITLISLEFAFSVP